MNSIARVLLTLDAAAQRTLTKKSKAWSDHILDIADATRQFHAQAWGMLGEKSIDTRMAAARLYVHIKLGTRTSEDAAAAALQITLEAKAAEESSQAAATRSWRKWVEKALLGGARAAHRWSNERNKPPVYPGKASDGSLSPQQMAEDARQSWMSTWQAGNADRTSRSKEAAQEVCRAARATGDAAKAAENIDAETLQQVARSFPPGTATGSDNVALKWMRDLPRVAFERLAALAKEIVRQQRWPQQGLQSVMCLLPKKLGGFRTIAIMPTITRLTMRAATCRARQWDAEAAEEGDSAAPKKQLVFEVSKRALVMELAAADGDCAAQILWDIEHFYDAVDIEGLASDVEGSVSRGK